MIVIKIRNFYSVKEIEEYEKTDHRLRENTCKSHQTKDCPQNQERTLKLNNKKANNLILKASEPSEQILHYLLSGKSEWYTHEKNLPEDKIV